jgi:hypothetical protein
MTQTWKPNAGRKKPRMTAMDKPTFNRRFNTIAAACAGSLVALLAADGGLTQAEVQGVLYSAISAGALLGGRYQLELLSMRPPKFLLGALAQLQLSAQALTAATRFIQTWLEGKQQPKPYSKLVADYNTRHGVQYGLTDAAAKVQSGEIKLNKKGGVEGEPLEPVWTRVFPRAERRNHHDKLNGTRPKADGKWTLSSPKGVFEISRPFDPAAPWSEWINCGHGVIYRRVK